MEQIEAMMSAKKDELEKLRELKKSVKAALANARKRRTPEERAAEAARPKRPLSENQLRWNAFVDSVYAELKKKNASAKRADAMKLAKERRAAGLAPGLPPKPPKPTDEEKAAAKAAKKAERDAAKKAAKGKAAAGAGSAAAQALSDLETSDSDSSDSEDETEDEKLVPLTVKGKTYWRQPSTNGCWHTTETPGELGEWAGLYDPAKNKIRSAPEPTLA